MLARAKSVCLLALSRSDRRVLALLLVRVDCAVLCCAVLAEQRKQKKSGRFPNKQNYPRQLQAERWESIPTVSSNVGEIQVCMYYCIHIRKKAKKYTHKLTRSKSGSTTVYIYDKAKKCTYKLTWISPTSEDIVAMYLPLSALLSL